LLVVVAAVSVLVQVEVRVVIELVRHHLIQRFHTQLLSVLAVLVQAFILLLVQVALIPFLTQ
jgi:hypothetical protein